MPSWGGRPGGSGLARQVRGGEVPVIGGANKVDSPKSLPDAADFYGLGLGEPVAVSAAQGLGTGDLLARIVGGLEASPRGDEAGDDDEVRLAVIGRPNVGKSSLVNRLLGE